MSNALKNAVESGASTLSDLVDDARSRIEDLPPLANARRRQTRKNWSPLFVVLVAAFAVVIVTKLRHHPSHATAEPTTL